MLVRDLTTLSKNKILSNVKVFMRLRLFSEVGIYTFTRMTESCFHRWVKLTIYPNRDNLFNSLIIFPGSASCVERLFSKLKLLRNGPQNQFSHLILESLLMIATDSLKQDPSDNTF